MQIIHDRKILQLIKVIPPAIVVTFAIIATLMMVNQNHSKLTIDINSLKKNFITAKKQQMEAQVKQLVQQISYDQRNADSLLRSDIKEHVYHAYNIVTSIYNANKDKSEQEVTSLIANALREIRFNNGRGYFFIYKSNGMSVMHPISPKIEGDEGHRLKNIVARDFAHQVKSNDEAFYTWHFVKPNDKSQRYQKVGFGKYFAPYDWFIGSGEYVIDVESQLKQQAAERVQNITYGSNDYFFLMDYQGNVLSHQRREFVGRNLKDTGEEQLTRLANDLIEIAKGGGGHHRYFSQSKTEVDELEKKISYVSAVPKWNWLLGTGFFISEGSSYLAEHTRILELRHRKQLLSLLGLGLIITGVFFILSMLLSKSLALRFTRYEDKINENFTEINRLKKQFEYDAVHDSLTKLPNRMLLEKSISDGIALSRQNNLHLAVVFLDLDNFKNTNDLYGHSVGDRLLEIVSQKFNDILDRHDSVSRFGGDEFIFCFPNLIDLTAAQKKVDLILDIFKDKFLVSGKSIYSTASAGVAMYPSDGDVAEDLISKADIVLYKSKANQKGRSMFFDAETNERVKRGFIIESELRTALDEKEFSMAYQPQICVKTKRILGVEALIRWHSPSLGTVSPDEFISKAEDIGIIAEIGRFVIEKSVDDIKRFNQGRSSRDIQLSLNISPKQLIEADFNQHLFGVVNSAEIDPSLIMLEITENVLISDVDQVRPVLDALRAYGFKLSLDDFGTGYSSLSYLSKLPMNEIKIDRSFIEVFLTNPQSESLVKTIIAIGKFYNLTVVAEGVETQEQYERLKHYDCNLIQGYYFDKPLSLKQLTDKYQLYTVI